MRLLSVLYLAAALLLGAHVAGRASRALEITFHDKALPPETVPERRPAQAAEPLARFEAIVAPEAFARDYDQGRFALDALARAVERRSVFRPPLVAEGRGRVIRVGISAMDDPDAFTVRVADGGVEVRGGSELGAAYGVYHLARLIRDGAPLPRDETVRPVLRRRYVDLGAVGMVPDADAWRGDDYSHHLRAFEDVLLARAPYVDDAALARVRGEFEEYVRRIVAYGYNGLVVNGFLEYVDFEGLKVYGAEDRARHRAMRESIGGLFRYADEQGLRIVFRTDMLALTAPLEAYLGERGALDPQLWDVYARGVDELFRAFPFAEGLMVRVGEAGGAYNRDGWHTYSRLGVTTDATVATMLRRLCASAAEHEKTIFFRTWSIGVGDVGDLHTNPETYERVLGHLDMPNLVVSTKYARGDFGSYLSLNPTLGVGPQARLVEFQARREFEACNVFPNYLGPLHQTALKELDRSRVAGVWVWTQDGGPQRAGPLSLYPFHGFWQPIDANVYATARLAWDPDADLAAITESWVREALSEDPETVAKLTDILFESRAAVLKGLYVGPFARRRVLAVGLEPPPMAWVFWDIVSGTHLSLSAVYAACRDDVDGAVAEGFEALAAVRGMRERAAALDRSRFLDPRVCDRLRESLAYEEDLFETLAWYRKALLSYYDWLATGDSGRYRDWRASLDRFREQKRVHVAVYGANPAFPAFNFAEAEKGLAHAYRTNAMMWLGRVLLTLLVGVFLLGSARLQRRLPAFWGKGACRALWVGLLHPHALPLTAAQRRGDHLAVRVVPLALLLTAHLTFSSFLAPTYSLLVVLLLGALLLALHMQHRRRSRFWLWAGAGAPLLAGTALLVGVVAFRGPLLFWYEFWTDTFFRHFALTAAVGVLAWFLFVLYQTERRAYGRPAVETLGRLACTAGVPLAVLGATVHVIGLEQSVARVGRELSILPDGLAKTLGVTTHLNIPSNLALIVALVGFALALAGWTLAKRSEARSRRFTSRSRLWSSPRGFDSRSSC